MTPAAQQFISDKISIHVREGYPQRQAIAMAYSKARAAGYKVPAAPSGSPAFVKKAVKKGLSKSRGNPKKLPWFKRPGMRPELKRQVENEIKIVKEQAREDVSETIRLGETPRTPEREWFEEYIHEGEIHAGEIDPAFKKHLWKHYKAEFIREMRHRKRTFTRAERRRLFEAKFPEKKKRKKAKKNNPHGNDITATAKDILGC